MCAAEVVLACAVERQQPTAVREAGVGDALKIREDTKL